MRKFFYLLFVVGFIKYATLFGAIIETAHFDEITKYVTPKTLVLLDIDDTLLIPTQTLGTDVWFMYRIKQHESTGMGASDALEKALAEWEAVRHLTNIKIVEEGTEKIVSGLQEKGVVVMALTTQGLALATRTVKQLEALNIHPAKTAPSNQDHYFINKIGVLYRQGILFTSGTPKGKALLKFLDLIEYKPEHIIFINDKTNHLMDVEEEVIARGIHFTGLRYSYCDERVANFRPEIAELQWKFSSFDHLISDKEAENLLHSNASYLPH